jgi:CMP-N,N'-diacetyllegionaminic acid synthase
MKIKFAAIITARGGSKRLPKKNILELAGKPLIAWTIEAAKKCSKIEDIIVTTDSDEIEKIAIEFGARVPFKRPDELSNDTATSFDVVKHCLDYLNEKEDKQVEYLVLLQPTSPLRSNEDINKAIELLELKNAAAVVSVCPTEHSPLWSNTLDNSLSLDNFLRDEVKNSRSQDLPTYYRLNGAIYVCKVEDFLKEKSFFLSKNSFAYEMSTECSVDIDTQLDFLVADFLLKQKIEK